MFMVSVVILCGSSMEFSVLICSAAWLFGAVEGEREDWFILVLNDGRGRCGFKESNLPVKGALLEPM